MRGLEQMEKRLAQLEKRLAKLEGAREAAAARRRPRRRRPQRRSRSARRSGRLTPSHVRTSRTRARASAPGTTSKIGGRRPDLLALDLDRQVLARVDLDARAPHDLDLRVRDVPALVDLRRRRQEVDLADVADQDDVEQRRRRAARPGASFIPPPCQTPFATTTSCIRAAPLAVVELDRHLGVLPLEEHARQRIEERQLAAERLRHPVRALRDGAAHADRADVREPALGVLAAPGPVADAAGVDRARRAVERDPDRVVELRRDAVGAAEVHAGAERDRREVDVAAGDAVHDLVQRPVAADRDDERRAAVDRLPRELDQVARPLGEERLAAQAEPRGAVRELGPALARRAVVGRRVDEEDGLLGQSG